MKRIFLNVKVDKDKMLHVTMIINAPVYYIILMKYM